MSVSIDDAPSNCAIPCRKTITIGSVAGGAAVPEISGDRLTWHVTIDPLLDKAIGHVLSGFGPSVRNAIGDAVIRERRDLKLRTQFLADLEKELGVGAMTDAQIVAAHG
jgi:hypothetical protein